MSITKKQNYFYGTGRRKTSTARVFLKSGEGRFRVKIQKKAKATTQSKPIKGYVDLKDYFKKAEQVQLVLSPLRVLDLQKSFDISVTVKGGGFTGQAGAIRHGLARALLKASQDSRPKLKGAGFLTRDSRMVERKKYGHHKARKSSQFSKR